MGLSVLMKSWTRKARHTTWGDAASGGRGFARKAVHKQVCSSSGGPEPQPSCQQRVGVSALPLTQGDQQRPVYNTIPQRADHKESSAMAGFVQGPTAVRRRKGQRLSRKEASQYCAKQIKAGVLVCCLLLW